MSTGNTEAKGSAGVGPPDAAPEGTAAGNTPEHSGPGQADAAGPPDEAVRTSIASLEQALAAARAEAQEAREQALRALAEADNVRKRTERDLENAHKYALDRFVAELLPVKDSIELGLAAEGAGADQLREGAELTLRMLAGAIEKFGVREVDPGGERFDPERHQAMSTRAVEGAKPGDVVQVVQKGYLLNDRLVRPALVIVAE